LSLTVTGLAQFGSVFALSVVDVVSCGSSLSLHGFAPNECRWISSYRFMSNHIDFRCRCSRLSGALSVLDPVAMGSVLSLRGPVRLGEVASGSSPMRMASLSMFDYANFGNSLSLQSFSRLGSSASVVGLARLYETRLASSLSGSGSLILVSSAPTCAVARLGRSLSAARIS
jgi:hypothetical protein